MIEHRKNLAKKIAANFEANTFPSEAFAEILGQRNWPNIKTGYNQFMMDEYAAFKKQGLRLTMHDVASKWNSLSDEEKDSINKRVRDVEIENIHKKLANLFEADAEEELNEVWKVVLLPMMIQDLIEHHNNVEDS